MGLQVQLCAAPGAAGMGTLPGVMQENPVPKGTLCIGIMEWLVLEGA